MPTMACPSCQAPLKFGPEHAGRQVLCPRCRATLTIPTLASPAEAAPPPVARPVAAPAAPPVPRPAPAAPPPQAYRAPEEAPEGEAEGFEAEAAPPRDWPKTLAPLARIMLTAGLLLVVFGRGCEALMNRRAAGASARAEAAKNAFNDRWDRELADLELQFRQDQAAFDAADAERQELDRKSREPGAPAAEIAAQVEKKRTELKSLTDGMEARRKDMTARTQQKEKEERELRSKDWRDLERSARSADTSPARWGYWFEVCFVCGTLLLAVGLLGAGFVSAGAERWVLLVLAGIILFSVYVAGMPWVSSIKHDVESSVRPSGGPALGPRP